MYLKCWVIFCILLLVALNDNGEYPGTNSKMNKDLFLLCQTVSQNLFLILSTCHTVYSKEYVSFTHFILLYYVLTRITFSYYLFLDILHYHSMKPKVKYREKARYFGYIAFSCPHIY